nr:toxin VasX [uncultured Caldimonas sp.]
MTQPQPTSTCSICDYSGLGIVFLSHAAVAIDQTLAPSEASELETHGDSVAALGLPTLAAAKLVLRSLRPGTYLHIYHETPPAWLKKRAAELDKRRAPKDRDPDEAHWEVLRMIPGGALVPQDHPCFDAPAPFACTKDGGTHIYTAMTYRLRDAHLATGIRVAVSGNLWSRELRARNKGDLAVMERIDIQAALAGNTEAFMKAPRKASPFVPAPDAQWFNKHVADFALHTLEHARYAGAQPLAAVKGNGTLLAQRIQALSAGHPQTAGKGFAYVLRDPVGTAQALAHISGARYKQSLDYAHSKSHGLKSAGTIEMIRAKIYDAQLEQAREKAGASGALKPFTQADLKTSSGRQRFTEKDARLALQLAKSGIWLQQQETSYQSYENDKKIHRNVHAEAVYLKYADNPSQGLVLTTREQLAQINTGQATQKMDRLHNRAALQAFVQQYEQEVKRYEALVEQHDRDRERLLSWAPLAAYMQKHYDPADPNSHQRPHKPGEAYMSECCAVLMAGPPTAALTELMRQWLTAVPSSDAGWVLRAMVANQQALVAELESFWAATVNWYTNPDAKLDKSYDTLKALLSDDYTGGYVRAKFGWLSQAGIELSLSVQAFLSGAAEHLKSSAFAKAAEQAAKNAQTSTVSRADRGLQLLELAEEKLSNKINAWSEQFSMLLRGVLFRQPPPRPVRVRVWIELEQFLELVEHLSQRGVNFNRKTRTLWNKVMTDEAFARKVGREAMWIELVSDDVTLRNSQDVMALGRESTSLRLTVLGGGAKLMRTIDVTTAWLAEHFARAHRFDKLKNSTLRVASEGIPMASTAALLALSTPARGALEGVKTVAGPGGTIERGVRGAVEVAGAAGRGVQQVGRALSASEAAGLGGCLSVFGVALQWSLYQTNDAKIEQLRERLLKWPDLTEEQKQAINDAILMTKLGLWDNQAGMTGGMFELAGLAAADMRQAKFAQGAFASKAMSGVAATFFLVAGLAGAVGGVMNAAQNFKRGLDKWGDGKRGKGAAFISVGAAHLVGGGFGGAAAVEVGYHWILERQLLEGVTLRGVKNSAGRYVGLRFGYGWARLGLSLTGWGLVLTVLAFSAEGLLMYMDRTPLEEWVEHSYFGNSPKYRKLGQGYDDPKRWDPEEQAFVRALQKAQADALTWDKVQEAEGPFPRLEPAKSRS